MAAQHALPPIDFTSGALAHRLRSGQGRGGALARAVGVRAGAGDPLRVVDATAGLGRDAFILASLQCRVTMIERCAPVHAALAAAIAHARAAADADIAGAAGRLTLLAGDARQLLGDLAADVVLIDPMHPDRGNSALVKQAMRQLRLVVGHDDDAAELIAAALRSAARRVVLKWPRHAGLPPGLRKPSHQIQGRTTRYDVFVRG